MATAKIILKNTAKGCAYHFSSTGRAGHVSINYYNGAGWTEVHHVHDTKGANGGGDASVGEDGT